VRVMRSRVTRSLENYSKYV